MAYALTAKDLIRELSTVTSQSDARNVVTHALRVVGVSGDRPLQTEDLLRLCEAIAIEGGLVREVAELIAQGTLDPHDPSAYRARRPPPTSAA